MTELNAEKIPITQGLFVLVDREDYCGLSKYKWHALKVRNTHYAYRTDGWKKKMAMHHAILGKPQPGMMVDHINGDGLDNRRENLRFVSNRVNSGNRAIHRNGLKRSRFVGVTWNNSSQKWMARIKFGQKYKYLGVFLTEEAAGDAYKKAAGL